jgi:SPX domain protein involved in polyphosphate accumulation
MAGGMQACRYECKYLLQPNLASHIRDHVRAYLAPDTFTNPVTGEGYPVHSLYLDSPNLKLCRQTLSGDKNRYKLRIRFYDDDPANPVFFEIKRRVNDVILKQRAGVWRSAVAELLNGKAPTPAMLVKPNELNMRSVRNFYELAMSIDAKPAAYTSYRRAAFEPTDDNRCRVTFDDELRAGEFHDQLSVGDLQHWPRPAVNGIVLELKFTDRRPNWMGELVDSYGLQRISVPKYVECMSLVDQSWTGRTNSDPRMAHDVPLSVMFGNPSNSPVREKW